MEKHCAHTHSDDSEWVVDTVASHHVTPHMSYFTSYTAGMFGDVKMGNSSSVGMIRIGTVIVETDTGCKMVLHDVRHVPNLQLSLMSGPHLDREGYHLKFGGGRCKVIKVSLIIVKGKLYCILYKTQVKVLEGSVHTSEANSGDF